MNTDEVIQKAKPLYDKHTVDREDFRARLYSAFEEQGFPKEKRISWRKQIMVTAIPVALVALVGLSPTVANALQQIPVVNVVMDWVRGTPAVQFVKQVRQSATDHGITVTITDVLYDPGQISLGYTVTPVQSGFPTGGVMSLGARTGGMEFYENGSPLHLQEIGSDGKTEYGYEGLVNIDTGGKLPDEFNLQIVIHKIGHQRGVWTFNIPVSKKDSSHPLQTFLPMKTETIGQTTITVERVKVYSTTNEIDYSLTEPVGFKKPVSFTVYDDKGNLFGSLNISPKLVKPPTTKDGMETLEYSVNCGPHTGTPQSLMFVPSIPVENDPQSTTTPVTGQFPMTFNYGMLGQLRITNIEVRSDKTQVDYQWNRLGPPFTIIDLDHPNAPLTRHGMYSDEGTAVMEFSPVNAGDKLAIITYNQNLASNIFKVSLK